jgi:hypothetical protein
MGRGRSRRPIDPTASAPPAPGDQLELQLDEQADDRPPTRKRWAWLLRHVFALPHAQMEARRARVLLSSCSLQLVSQGDPPRVDSLSSAFQVIRQVGALAPVALTRLDWKEARKMTDRERKLLTETPFTRPVEFHSFPARVQAGPGRCRRRAPNGRDAVRRQRREDASAVPPEHREGPRHPRGGSTSTEHEPCTVTGARKRKRLVLQWAQQGSNRGSSW